MSLNRICKQCGKRFTLSDSEIAFYNSKNLDLPKRCKECRELNKGKKSEYSSYTKRLNASKKASVLLGTAAGLTALFILLSVNISLDISAQISLFTAVGAAILVFLFAGRRVDIEEFDTSPFTYTFYDTKSMVSHYAKHGAEVECGSMHEYLTKANLVIKDKSALKKIQKSDGDTAYFNPQTKDFVVVAKAGYIRTYFKADMYYFNKQ